MKKFFNWLINSEYSETVGSIFIGIGYIGFLIGVFLIYISIKGV